MRNCLGDRNTGANVLPCTNTSGYRGVYWHKGSKAWTAVIAHEGKKFQIGRFGNKKAAAKAYDERARALKGRKAVPNFPTKDEILLRTKGKRQPSKRRNSSGYL